MYSLFRKELNTFFGSVTGYLVVSIFLLATSVFLWIIPGSYNLIEGEKAALNAFFDLAPWLYLFLIPAITMRMFAEEKRMGTIEMIITRPITAYGIILSKFMAAMVLVLVSLIPTLMYFYSVYQLGNPVGNIDIGATWGSYIGLVFLAAVYVGIGLFSSVITSNQVVSFLIAIALSFILFLGLEYLASIGLAVPVQNAFLKLSIHEHYLSISRGIVDSRDILYFISTTLFFLYITRQFILKRKLAQHFKWKNILLIAAFWIVAIWLVNERFFRIDLTAEKRYTLSEESKSILAKQEQSITFEIYLAGNLPPAMKDFQEAIIEKVEDLNAFSGKRIYAEVFDIYSLKSSTQRNNAIEKLIDAGIQPVNFGLKTTEGLSTKQIFPGVVVHGYNKGVALNLLVNNPYLDPAENLRQSIELLEYEFVKAIRMLQQNRRPTVAFLQGHSEATEFETGDLRYSLTEKYHLIDCSAESLLTNDSIETLIIAAPQEPFNEKDKLHIDQFIMNGGNVLWCIDPVTVYIDSLSKGHTTIAFEKGLNLRDQIFRYGVRINSDILQDAFCLKYPVNTAPKGQQANFTPAPFYYSPLALPNPNHPLSRNLNNVMMEFVSSLSLTEGSGQQTGVPILATSPYGRSIQTPVEVSLMSATNPPDQQLFNQPNIPIGVLLEGKFESAFKNRMTQHLGITNAKQVSPRTSMIVIADGDLIKNKVQNRNGRYQIQPLGYDQYSQQTFGNKDFILNCVDYLTDDSGIMQLRSKVVKLRPLDKVRLRDEMIYWKMINTILPVILFSVFGFIFNWIRRKKYQN